MHDLSGFPVLIAQDNPLFSTARRAPYPKSTDVQFLLLISHIILCEIHKTETVTFLSTDTSVFSLFCSMQRTGCGFAVHIIPNGLVHAKRLERFGCLARKASICGNFHWICLFNLENAA